MIIAIDTETGGINPGENALLSIALVKLNEELTPIDTLSLLVLPESGQTVEDEAARINGYTAEKWMQDGAVPLFEAMKRVAMFVPFGAEPLAHNAGFDKAFFEAAQRRTRIKTSLSYRWHCSLATFQACNLAYDWGFKKMNLEVLAREAGHWGPDFVRQSHGALEDAYACAAGYRWLLTKMKGAR